MQKTEMVPSKIGFGCWPLGGDQWGTQNDRDSVAAIEKAFESGINHFDTAQMYGRGHAEELLGKTLKDARDNVFIATKILYTPKDKVEDAVGFSLRRLRTDYIDLLYIHWPKRNGDLAGMMETMERLRRNGIIRLIGVSNFSVFQMQEVMKAGTIDVHQLCYNVLWRREERETIPFCRNNGIRIVTYSSLAEGILTGKFQRELDFPQGDHRKYTVLFEKAVWPNVFDAVERLKKVAEEALRPLSHCALRWLCAKEGVVSVLAGCRTPQQVMDNARSLEGSIGQDVFDRMTEISDCLAPALPDAGNIFRWYP
ncbi:MAG: aldo/keto reductase [Chitinispirillaceae bacterium]|nr:aldo/keto reductase [Chitinispirillaceae bacterium]